jgi:hypothetical protein
MPRVSLTTKQAQTIAELISSFNDVRLTILDANDMRAIGVVTHPDDTIELRQGDSWAVIHADGAVAEQA